MNAKETVLVELHKLMLNFTWNSKCSAIAKTILYKKTKNGEVALKVI